VQGELTALHGWHYVIEEGMVYVMEADGSFKPVEA
jgi:hypothetical protein